MAELPVISGREARHVFEKNGLVFRRQKGTLRKLIRLSGLSVDNFLKLR